MNISNVIIRTETPNDYPKVYDVNSKAFGRNEEAQLVDKLRASDSFIEELSLVATIDSQVVGYILFSKINIVRDDIKHPSLALAPMSVLPKYQNYGIGSLLVTEGLNKARELGHESVMVLGHDGFYPRFNFTPANKWNIKPPFNVPSTTFMALELKEGALDNIHGYVEYPPALLF